MVCLTNLSLATYEPHHSMIHGGIDKGELLVIYEYNVDEFYDNTWKSELKFYKKQNLSLTRNRNHSLLRNYHKIMKSSNINLVEICEVNNIMYCVLHTYKINILKRKWRNSRIQL
jgi:hypothetical protein